MNVPLADDHRGLKCNPRFMTENGRGYVHMRRMMQEHLQLLAREYYKGNISVVDEFLQLYCFSEEARKKVKELQSIQPDYEI